MTSVNILHLSSTLNRMQFLITVEQIHLLLNKLEAIELDQSRILVSII